MKLMNKNNLAGFTLLKVMISIIFLSCGLLGAAGMQMKSQQFNRSAYFDTQAIIIAHDMLERIRYKVAGQRQGYYHFPNTKRYSNLLIAETELQQNARFAFSIITNIVQKAGNLGCKAPTDVNTRSLLNFNEGTFRP